MITGHEQAAGHIAAVLIGTAELAFLVWTMYSATRGSHKRHRRQPFGSKPDPAVSRRRQPRSRADSREQAIVRQRLTGQIDPLTYQARMAALVRSGR